MCKTSSSSRSTQPVNVVRRVGNMLPPSITQAAPPVLQMPIVSQATQPQPQMETIVAPPSLDKTIVAQNMILNPMVETKRPMPVAMPMPQPKEEVDILSDEEDCSDDERDARALKPACINCRRSKVRCEGGIPCRRCLRLSIETSCQRCEPKKRGRKRKIRPATEETQLLEALFEQARQSKNVDVSTLLPARTAESLEKDEIERFAALTAQFRLWREQLTTDPNVEQSDLMRFLWFCSYLSHVINGYIGQFHNPVQAQKLVSVWLCSNLADDVNRFVTSLGQDIVAFPTIEETEDLQSAVEKQIYKSLPTGVVVLSLNPRPFHSGNKPWVNPKMCQMLGYSKDELRVLMSQRQFFLRLMHSSTYATWASHFWQAVAHRKTSFTIKSKWVHKSGREIDTVGTYWIKYMQGLPVSVAMFHQTPPSGDSLIQEVEKPQVSAAHKMTHESYNPTPQKSMQSNSASFSLNFSENATVLPTVTPVATLPVAVPVPAAAAAATTASVVSTTAPVVAATNAPAASTNNTATTFPISPSDLEVQQKPQQVVYPAVNYKDEGFWDLSPISPNLANMGPSAMLDLVLNPNQEF